MARSATPPRRPLLRRPDARGLVVPRLSGQPLTHDEQDRDDLVVHRSWRSYDAQKPDTVRYFCYQISQRDAGSREWQTYVKAVRMLRVTRVPRYLRQTQGNDDGVATVFESERDMLKALRGRGVLFLNLIAKSPDIPLVFAWGVQAVGETTEEAMRRADESYAVLEAQVVGTFQQLEYKPLTVDEGERLAQYQQQWGEIAVARGRPLPSAMGHAGASAWLDGSRTAVESSANQLESFIRGMTDKSFMLSLVTTPVSPYDMTTAWRNLSKKLSQVRSDQEGSRGISAGVAFPFGFGLADGSTHGTTHAAGETQQLGMAEQATVAEQQQASLTETVGETHGVTESHQQSHGVSEQVSESEQHTVSASEAVGQSEAASRTLSAAESQQLTESVQEQVSAGRSVGESAALTESTQQSVQASESMSESQQQSVGEARSSSVAEQQGVSSSTAVQEGVSESTSESASASSTSTFGQTLQQSDTLQQVLGVTDTVSESETDGESRQEGSRVGAGIPGLSGGFDEGQGWTFSEQLGESEALSHQLSGGTSLSEAVSQQLAEQVGRSVSAEQGVSASATQTAGESASVTSTDQASVNETVSAGQSRGVTQSAGLSEGVSEQRQASQSVSEQMAVATGQSLGHGYSLGESTGATQQSSQQSSVGQATSAGRSHATGVTQTDTSGVATSQQASQASAAGVSRGVTEGLGQTSSQQVGASDTYMAAVSQSAQRTGTGGIMPQMSYNMMKRTFNESARTLGDFIEAQYRRYIEGIESGAWLYQMFLQTPDRDTLLAGAGLMESAWWGTGGKDKRLPQPFTVHTEFDRDEDRELLREHAAAFTTYRRREPRIELMEPYLYSTIITPTEAAAFSHPPTAESIGLLAVHDSMPVMAMPADRGSRDIPLGRVVNGERARVEENTWVGIDLDELADSHMLIAGTTGFGKTTTAMRLVSEAVRTNKHVVERDRAQPGGLREREVPAGALCLDWSTNFRKLANVVEPERFQLFNLTDPSLGRFRYNLLALPDSGITPADWVNTVSDLFMISYGLGEYARSIIWEQLNDLFSANRLERTWLREPVIDPDNGSLLREGVALEPVDPDTLPDGAVVDGPDGRPVANVFTCPELSRLVSLQHLAVKVAAAIEAASGPNGARSHGSEHLNRLQTVWRRLQYFAPGGPLAELFDADPALDERTCLRPTDLVDPDRGLVTVLETEGLDQANRRLVIGGVLMGIWRYGQHHGDGTFSHGGQGPGTLLVLEEGHELFGDRGEGEDPRSAATRTSLYEAMFRRARSLGLVLCAVVQNPASIPSAITGNTATVISHTLWDQRDRDVIANLMNWQRAINQHYREVRYLGEMPVGYIVLRLRPKDHFLDAAPIHLRVEELDLPDVSDVQLRRLARRR